jgi:hypothetical protein
MPLRGTDKAPKFEGATDKLIEFIEDVNELADLAQISGAARIKAAMRYASSEESETWALLDEAAGTDWDKFVKAVKTLYPGCEGDRRFTRADLAQLSLEQSRIPMNSQTELGAYYRKFFKISKFLISKKKLSELERNQLFQEGFHADISAHLRHRLSILHTDHHPGEPYEFDKVYAAAVFLLPGTSAVTIPALAQPSPRTGYAPQQQQYAPSPQPPRPQPSPGVVVKQEYMAPQRSAPGPCHFCGGTDHYQRWCLTRKEYIRDGKCQEIEGRIVMSDGRGIPGFRESGTYQQRIDKFLQQSPATGANATVIAGLYCRSQPEVEVALDIDASAYSLTRAAEETDEVEESDEELNRLEQAAMAACAAYANVRARKPDPKGKSVRFDGVEVPARAKPGPSSKAVTAEEIVSPQVKEAAGKPTPSTTTAPKPATATSNIVAPTIPTPTVPKYKYVSPLDDKTADKRIVDRMLDTNVNLPMRELFAVSQDVRKIFRELTTTKRVSEGTLTVNELIARPEIKDFLKRYDDCLARAEDGRIVAAHFEPLRCIKATLKDGRVITCVLDQGAECIVMPRKTWQGIGGILRPDYKMYMESVNTSTDATLGVIENLSLDFGAGEMWFQIQVIEAANFEILLGRPFFTLTSCRTKDLPTGDQEITLTDPNTGKEFCIPTEPWVKKCIGCQHNLVCIEHTKRKGF